MREASGAAIGGVEDPWFDRHRGPRSIQSTSSGFACGSFVKKSRWSGSSASSFPRSDDETVMPTRTPDFVLILPLYCV